MTGVHALIIENDQDSIDVLGQLLKRENATYTAVSDPTQLQAADLKAVNVIFLDLDMPNMDGFTVFDLLRNGHEIHVPIIAYTVNTNEKATVRKMGFDGMLAKPLDMACFGDQLRRIMAGEALWDAC